MKMNKYQKALDNVKKCNCIDCTCAEIDTLQELVDNYEKLMKAFNDRKVLIESITNDNGVGIFECEADIWATIGGPIVRLGE